MVGATVKTRVWFAIYLATLVLPFIPWLLNAVGVSSDMIYLIIIAVMVAAVPMEIAAFFILRQMGIMPALRWVMLAQLVMLLPAAAVTVYHAWVVVFSAAIGVVGFFLSWYAMAVNRGEYYPVATFLGGATAYMVSGTGVLFVHLIYDLNKAL